MKVISVERYERWVVPRPISEVNGAPSVADNCASEERKRWIEQLGGIPRQVGVWVTIVSNRDDPIVITGLQVDVRRKSFDGAGTNVELCAPGGEGVPIHYISVDLDSDPPEVVMHGTEDPDADLNPQPGGRYSISLNKGEAAELFITAGSYSSDERDFDVLYEWTATLLVRIEGEQRVFVIDDNGAPFITATCVTGPTFTTSTPTPPDQVILCPSDGP